MSINDNVLNKIRERKNSMTPVERLIAEYILANKEEIPHLSIKSLAQASKTSDASVLRFCKTMGYGGYRSFIVSISALLGSMEPEDQYMDIQPGDELTTIISNIGRNHMRSIEDTLSVLDRSAVERAVEALRTSSRIVFFGSGVSGLVAKDAEQKFTCINKMCHAYVDGHSQLMAATLLSKDDVAIFISHSGNTIEILDAVDLVKKNGAHVVAITKYGKSELSEKADTLLNISGPEISIHSGALGSRIAMLTIIDMLFVGVASADYQQVKKYLSMSHNVIDNKRRR